MDTSASFLESLQSEGSNERWTRLVDLYSPLIRRWLTRLGAAISDLDDLEQEVLAVVVRRFPDFELREQVGSFRNWLRTICGNCLKEQWRKRKKGPQGVGGTDFGQQLEQFADAQSELSRIWNEEHDRHVTRHLLAQVQSMVTESTWRTFKRFALDGCSADEVAAELGCTANAVFIAKSRVMAKLRQLGKGLLEDDL